MGDSIIRLFQFIYKWILISFYYWIYLLKGGIIYSFIPATASLWMASQQMITNKEMEIKDLFKENYANYSKSPLISFIAVFLNILVSIALFFINRSDHMFSLAMVIICVYLLVLINLNIVYTIYYLIFEKQTIRYSLALAFVTAIKHPIRSLGILLIFLCLSLLAWWNLIAFLAFGPSLFGISIHLLFQLKKL